MNAAKEYTNKLAEDLTKITMADFFQEIHSKFYSSYDISFMNYFLELTEHESEFYVHHSKLIDYGIMTSNRSNDVQKKLNDLNLIKDQDYLQRDISQQVPSGTKHSKHYHLTPEAFKKCLMRAKRIPNQPVDPVIYIDYYLLLEKVHKLYTDYERKFSEITLQMQANKLKFANMYNRFYSDSLHKKIDEQTKKIDEERIEARKRDEEQRAQIAELRGYAIETKETLGEVQNDLTETKEEVKIAKSYLEEKSFTSTRNPTNENKHHYFAATTYFDKDQNQIVKFVSGQKSYVNKTIQKNVSDLNHQIIINPFFNANGIDLRQNVHEEFVKRRADRVKEINASNVLKDRDYNSKLQVEIRKHNKANPNNKRVYSDEKRKSVVVKTKDILVNFTKLSFKYTNNPYIVFDEVLQIIIDVNDITQESPLPSDEE